MNIGIITYHRAYNYGALLQAVATRVYMESLGHNVMYIDYWPKYHADSYKLFNNSRFSSLGMVGKAKYLLSFALNYWGNKKRFAAFTPFVEKYILPYCQPYANQQQYDVVLYGSDQIWRKQSDGYFNWVYFGQNEVNTKKHISLSASMGKVDINKHTANELKKRLQHLHSISVRESDLADAIRDLGLDVKVTIDPTLLLTKDQWNNIVPTKRIIPERYVLMYDIGPSFKRTEVETFAKTNGLKLVVIGPLFDIRRFNDRLFTSPTEFISLIKYADYVITSSYHGLMFSLIYEKQFVASFKKNPDRAKSILDELGLKNYLLEYQQTFSIPGNKIDYCLIRNKIEELKKNTITYLNNL